MRTICVASRDNKPIGDKMIMNAAFLIEREREAEFDAAVNRIAKKFGDRLNFKYTGPWPPYNFVNIRLEAGTQQCGLRKPMLFLDDLLLSPITGFKFILRTLARAAEEEYTDDAPIKERLLELQTLLDEGSISEEEYVEQEREILAVLREIQDRRMQMAGVTPEDAERMGRPMMEIPVQLPDKGSQEVDVSAVPWPCNRRFLRGWRQRNDALRSVIIYDEGIPR